MSLARVRTVEAIGRPSGGATLGSACLSIRHVSRRRRNPRQEWSKHASRCGKGARAPTRDNFAHRLLRHENQRGVQSRGRTSSREQQGNAAGRPGCSCCALTTPTRRGGHRRCGRQVRRCGRQVRPQWRGAASTCASSHGWTASSTCRRYYIQSS